MTDLPASAASISALTIGLSRLVRYSVCLTAIDVRVLRGLAEELHHHVEALERMVDDDVLGADGGEAVAAEIADAFGEARRVGREQQVRPVIDDQLLEIDDAEQAVGHVDLVGRGASLVGDQVRAGPPASLASVPRWIATPRRRRFSADLVGADQILGLFLEFHVGVADQPEHALAADTEAGEQPVQEQGHDIFQQDEADRVAGRRRAAG